MDGLSARRLHAIIHVRVLYIHKVQVLSARNPIFPTIIAPDFSIALDGRLIKRIGLLRAYWTHAYVALARLILGVVDSDVQIPFAVRGCVCARSGNVLTHRRATSARRACVCARI